MKKTIFSKAKSVIVLKAIGMAPLRIFPGYNYVEEKGLENYFKNDAAMAQRKEHLDIVGGELEREDAEQAAAAKAKNDSLNKATRIIKANAKQITAGEKTIKEQSDLLTQQSEMLSDQEKTIGTLMSRLDTLEKAQVVDPEPAPEPKPKKGK